MLRRASGVPLGAVGGAGARALGVAWCWCEGPGVAMKLAGTAPGGGSFGAVSIKRLSHFLRQEIAASASSISASRTSIPPFTTLLGSGSSDFIEGSAPL